MGIPGGPAEVPPMFLKELRACSNFAITHRYLLSIPNIYCQISWKRNWKKSSLKLTRKHRPTDVYGSATKRKTGSGRPKTARAAENVEHVAELICSAPRKTTRVLATSKSTRQIAQDLQVSAALWLHAVSVLSTITVRTCCNIFFRSSNINMDSVGLSGWAANTELRTCFCAILSNSKLF